MLNQSQSELEAIIKLKSKWIKLMSPSQIHYLNLNKFNLSFWPIYPYLGFWPGKLTHSHSVRRKSNEISSSFRFYPYANFSQWWKAERLYDTFYVNFYCPISSPVLCVFHIISQENYLNLKENPSGVDRMMTVIFHTSHSEWPWCLLSVTGNRAGDVFKEATHQINMGIQFRSYKATLEVHQSKAEAWRSAWALGLTIFIQWCWSCEFNMIDNLLLENWLYDNAAQITLD